MTRDRPTPASTDRSDGPDHGVRSGVRPGDVGAIVAVAGVLILTHVWLPAGSRERLALDHARVAPHTIFTSAYVHLDTAHLAGNLLGYLMAALLTYGLAIESGRLRWFRVTLLIFLVALPIGVNLAMLGLYDVLDVGVATSRGFSGVVAGFGGLMLVAAVGFLRRRYSHLVTLYTAGLLTLLVLGEMLVIVADPVRPVWFGVLTVGVLVGVSGLVSRWRRVGLPPTATAWMRVIADTTVVVAIGLVLTWFVLALFPAQPVGDGRATNVIAHAVGGLFGALLAVGTNVLIPRTSPILGT